MSASVNPFDYMRTPFENVVNFLGGLPQGHEKALKNAIYNSLALFLLFISSAAAWALYIILGPFIRPLLWALMCGSVLHPFKRLLASKFNEWITAMECSRSPFIFCLLMVPVNLTNDVSELIGNVLVKHWRTFMRVAFALSCLTVIYSYTPHMCVCLALRISSLLGSVLAWFIDCCNTFLLATVLAVYVGLLAVFWSPERSRDFERASWPLWTVISCCVARQVDPSWRVLVFLLVQCVFLAGFVLDVWNTVDEADRMGNSISLVAALKAAISCDSCDEGVNDISQPKQLASESSGTATVPQAEREEKAEVRVREAQMVPEKSAKFQTAVVEPTDFGGSTNVKEVPRFVAQHDSDKYFYGVMWACLAMLTFNHLWVLYIAPVPLFIFCVKHTGHYFGVWQQLADHASLVWISICTWCKPRRAALCPIPVKGLHKVTVELHGRTLGVLKSSAESTASAVVIFGVIIFSIATTIFIAVQVYAEGMHVVQVGANVVHSNAEYFSEIVPDEWYSKVDSIVGNAYHQGREGISSIVRSWLTDVEETKRRHLEKQILDLWDRIYQSWTMTGADATFIGPLVPPRAVWDNFVEGFQKSPELLHFDGILDFAKKNMDSLVSVLQTVWTISKGNVSLALHSFTAIISILLGGGTAVLNLILNTVVFFTALFYLLNTSSHLYKPVDLITNFSPNYGNRFAVALEGAFSGVFKASFKMAVFYGLWTWLIHNVFRMKIVYLPSVLAALLAAVPVLGTYWACVPAVLDLWLVQDSRAQALLLVLAQMAPTYVVDTAFYKEIDGGGHPYLTGLSIAGGIFCLGAEGAIIGPVVLCGLFVVVNLSSSLLMDSPTDGRHIDEFSRMHMRSPDTKSAEHSSLATDNLS